MVNCKNFSILLILTIISTIITLLIIISKDNEIEYHLNSNTTNQEIKEKNEENKDDEAKNRKDNNYNYNNTNNNINNNYNNSNNLNKNEENIIQKETNKNIIHPKQGIFENKTTEEITEFKIGDGKNFRFGIISDTHIDPDHPLNEKCKENLINTLKSLKSQKIDVLIVAGDSIDSSTDESFEQFIEIYNSIFTNELTNPLLIILMGNHDYYNITGKLEKEEAQNRFEKYYLQKTLSHLKINNFHFIKWGSNDNEYIKSCSNFDWINSKIKRAILEDSKKPIFVITHLNAINTVHLSQYYGFEPIFNTLKNYYQIIHLSGHSHFSLIDERSIWQNQFTSIQTQSTSFIELDYNFENGSVPKDEFNNNITAYNNPMGLIFDVNNEKIEVNRILFNENKFYGKKWEFKIPFLKEHFMYKFDDRMKNFEYPFFNLNQSEFNKINVKKFQNENEKPFYVIYFKQALSDNSIYFYQVCFKGINKNFSNCFNYFSDFYLSPSQRRDIIGLRVNKNVPLGKYDVKIFAYDSFEKRTLNFINDTIILE